MKIVDRLRNRYCYFYFTLEDLPMQKMGIECNGSVAYCRLRNSTPNFEGLTSILTGVFDFFTDTPIENSIALLKEKDFLFGEILTFMPKLRGENKVHFIGDEPSNNDPLPHLATLSGAQDVDDDYLVTYFENGIYWPTKDTPTTLYKNVKHLNSTSIYDFFYVQLYILAELLKIQRPGLSDEEVGKVWDILWSNTSVRNTITGPWIKVMRIHFIKRYKKIPYKSMQKEIRNRVLS